MKVIGIDPGLKMSGLAIFDTSAKRVLVVQVVRIHDHSLKGTDAVLAMVVALRDAALSYAGAFDLLVVESQEHYLGEQGGKGKGGKSTPEDLVWLATVSGAALASFPAHDRMNPRPKDWKKGVPKGVHQARVAARLGWGYEAHPTAKGGWVEPKDFGAMPPVGVESIRGEQWSHTLDAAGLALWGVEQTELRARRNALR